MRTIAAPPPWRTWAIPETIEAVSHNPCWESSATAGKPSRATSSATIGAERPHQPLWTVSPALSRRAREKAVAVVMRSSSVVIGRAGGRCDGRHMSRLGATRSRLAVAGAGAGDLQWPAGSRSEEHTSELQSHSDLVCRLLLEKKKKNKDYAKDQDIRLERDRVT